MVSVNADFMIDALCLAAFSNTESSKDILSKILGIYLEQKKKNADVLDRDLDVFFEIIQDITQRDANLEKKAEINRVILKIKKSTLATKDPSLVDEISQLLHNSEGIAEKRIVRLTHRMSNWVATSNASAILRQMMKRINQFNPIDDMTNDTILTEIAEHAREVVKAAEGGYGMSATIDSVDMTDPLSIHKLLNSYTENMAANVIPTGWKCLNRMLGKDRGFKRGEFWAFGASSHNFKSGMLMNVARWACIHGNYVTQPGMIPCVSLITLENEAKDNALELLTRAYVNAYHREPEQDMPLMDLITMVAQYFSQRGVKFLMERKDENFGFSDYIKLMDDYKKRGLEVVCSVIDYITLMRVDEDSDNPAIRLQKLGQKLLNYAKRNNMLICTGLQLNGAADELNSSGSACVVKSYGAGHLSDCKGFRKALTGLIFMKKEINMVGQEYITCAWDKHRDDIAPPKEDRFFAMRFRGPVLGILDDYLLEEDTCVADPWNDNTGDFNKPGVSMFSASMDSAIIEPAKDEPKPDAMVDVKVEEPDPEIEEQNEDMSEFFT